MASPSGASPTTTRSMMRGGFASRSMTLTVSTLPSELPELPLSAVSAILPLGATATLVWPLPGRQIELAISYFIAIDVEQGNLVIVELGHKCAFPIGRKYGVRNNAAEIDGVYHLNISAFDRQHTD